MADEAPRKKKHGDAFTSVAIWQFLCFILLLCFVWASEFVDLPGVVGGAQERAPFNTHRVLVLSIAIGAAGVIAVGHTYEKQKSVVRRILKTCMFCNRIQTHKGDWEHVSDYFFAHYPADLQKGSCPACEEMVNAVNARVAVKEMEDEALADSRQE
jgi:hypothetical protein